MEDIDNPDLFVELGTISISIKFQPTRNFSKDRSSTQEDPSIIKRAEGGQKVSIQEPHFGKWEYTFIGTNQKDEFEAMFSMVGKSIPFFYCEDSDYPLTMTKYVSLTGWNWDHIAGDEWNLKISLEEER